jgi:hemerythrin-like domain-containing protein
MTVPGEYTTPTDDMRAVHAALLSSLASAPALVAGAGTDPAKVAVAASYCDNVLEFLHVHHDGEDELIYPVLEARCAQHKELLERIDAQHTLLAEPMTAARGAVAAWQGAPSAEAGRTVVDTFATVSDLLAPHLAEEEDEVLPIASSYMAPEEWAELPGHALRSFGGDKPWLALGLVFEQLPPEVRSQVLAGMPPPLQQLWADDWQPAFTGFMSEVESIAGPS